jgi:hypothetical protein
MSEAPKRRKSYPRGLQQSGKAFWDRVIDGRYTFDPAEYIILERLCRCLDTLDQIDRDIAEMGTVVAGSRSQPRPNPMLREQRETLKLVDQLCRSLALPVPGEAQGKRRSPEAKAAAKVGRTPKSNVNRVRGLVVS